MWLAFASGSVLLGRGSRAAVSGVEAALELFNTRRHHPRVAAGQGELIVRGFTAEIDLGDDRGPQTGEGKLGDGGRLNLRDGDARETEFANRRAYCLSGRRGARIIGEKALHLEVPMNRNAKRQRESVYNRCHLLLEPLEDRRLLAVGMIDYNAQNTSSGNAGSTNHHQSADGRYVVFMSAATNLVSGITDVNGSGGDVFRRDRQTNTTQLVSKSMSGNTTGNSNSFNPIISGNGRYVVFGSNATDLVPNDFNEDFDAQADVFIRDMQTGVTELVSVNLDGETTANQDSYLSSIWPTERRLISDNGRYVVFESDAPNLAAGDNNGAPDVFVRDTVSDVTIRVNVSSNEQQGIYASHNGVISANGRYVAFESGSTNLVPNDQNFNTKIFRRDLTAGTTELVTTGDKLNGSLVTGGSFLPKMSADGKMIVFETDRIFDSVDNDDFPDIYVRDMTKTIPELVTVDRTGQAANYSSFDPQISDDGRHVAFESLADDLVANDNDGHDLDDKDVFVRHLQTHKTELVSVNSAGTGSGNLESRNISISGNGRYVAWESDATNLIANYVDNNGHSVAYDIFRRDMGSHVTALVSVKRGATTQTANGGSNYPQMSQDGRFIVFHSLATDLVNNDGNQGQTTIFVSGAAYSAAAAGAIVQQTGTTTSVTEGGATDTYTLALKSKPTANVTITINPGSQLTVSPATITFTPLNWYVSRTIKVTAKNDTAVEGNHTGTITHTVASTDTHYNGLAISNLVVSITDNDGGAGALVVDGWDATAQGKRKK